MPARMSEVERKWRLEHVPTAITLLQGVPIVQAYLITEPGELRVRQKGNEYFMTVKGDGSLARSEWEKTIPKWVFDQLVASTKLTISKTRYTIPGEVPLEVDIFSGFLTGLVLVEAEWVGVYTIQAELEARAKAFKLPAELKPAREVTEDSRYKNKRLAALKELSELE